MKLLRLLAAAAVAVSTGRAASLQPVTDFGPNPTNIRMYIYVPDKVAAKPAVIVALHPCGTSASLWFGATNLPAQADRLGVILIYPQTTRYSYCWDVNSAASLTHGAGGDALGIVSTVNHTLATLGADPARVYVMGGSSGAMMTNVLAGSYPGVFAAGAVYSGTPFACSAGSLSDPTPMGANQTCAQGRITHSAAEWARFVDNAFPGYTGRRPRMLIAHGLADTLVRPACAYAALAQWAAVLNVTNTANATGSAVVEGTQYTQLEYGASSVNSSTQLVGFFGAGVGHIAPPNIPVMLDFFGLS